jgi:hypothetical protein
VRLHGEPYLKKDILTALSKMIVVVILPALIFGLVADS